MTGKYTPGPWVALLSNSRRRGYRTYSLEQDPHRDNWTPHTHQWMGDLLLTEMLPDNTQEANARLIAAAPELLEVCKLVQQAILEKPNLWAIPIATEDRLRAAIAKAEGR